MLPILRPVLTRLSAFLSLTAMAQAVVVPTADFTLHPTTLSTELGRDVVPSPVGQRFRDFDNNAHRSGGYLHACNFRKVSLILGESSSDAGDSAAASIWSGTGYKTEDTWPKKPMKGLEGSDLQSSSSALVQKLAEEDYAKAGSPKMNFSYSGAAAIAVFVGAIVAIAARTSLRPSTM